MLTMMLYFKQRANIYRMNAGSTSQELADTYMGAGLESIVQLTGAELQKPGDIRTVVIPASGERASKTRRSPVTGEGDPTRR
jgi:hypothetical protein